MCYIFVIQSNVYVYAFALELLYINVLILVKSF